MTALAWLAIPLVSLVLAVAWVAWAGRRRPEPDIQDTVADFQRFKAAFDAPRAHQPSVKRQS